MNLYIKYILLTLTQTPVRVIKWPCRVLTHAPVAMSHSYNIESLQEKYNSLVLVFPLKYYSTSYIKLYTCTSEKYKALHIHCTYLYLH